MCDCWNKHVEHGDKCYCKCHVNPKCKRCKGYGIIFAFDNCIQWSWYKFLCFLKGRSQPEKSHRNINSHCECGFYPKNNPSI